MVRKSRRRKQPKNSPHVDMTEEDSVDGLKGEEDGSENRQLTVLDSSFRNNLEEAADSENLLENRREELSNEQSDPTSNIYEALGEQVENKREEWQPENYATNSLPFQNPLQKKLFDIRLRMNEGRKLNSQAVEEELRTNHFRSKGGQVLRKSQQQNSSRTESTVAIGLKDKFWRETAEQAEQQLAKELIKKRRSGEKLIGETIYGEDNLYRAYEKRLTRIPASEIDRSKAQEEMDQLEYGQSIPIDPDRIEKMVEELEETEERRRKFSKWHKFDEESADISFINERNRRFNEKIARSFDEYTQEIRQNLERGTALP
ncbi:Pre-mRNA-splicing factor Syf2 [Galdieria sulphuraria]|uniref:Pre-mRNA-splicing factor SYF2 n=1 Tax=Galdieria sulphuraria TaxID=130081 RepID=M2XZC0_GALSU|nr:pre-mRNA-splicing factor SYF2 [Galdieria sulphuraria]EME28998.1 pre-mRNA-splicing factor SYF2 [Galdieria sulphuraria]GJD06936.1 Pre-mRNA-splicing factor Syf2 [Galdieria sulphuraria]|eukprot:XP_005705518.1 pre-mRNA-splicing factor SYF2 [Galdieria sulphuraria]